MKTTEITAMAIKFVESYSTLLFYLRLRYYIKKPAEAGKITLRMIKTISDEMMGDTCSHHLQSE
ncbi:hypothetical protein C5952_17530 [Cronobacter sakazakii]|nr:hypothetical protein C5952_17530 [Cronobacter sakazakii]